MSEWRINLRENLQDVVDMAPPGTVIRLTEGEYRQKIVIRTPDLTLIGAGQDQIVGAEASRLIAEQIPDSLLIMFDDYSHGVYDETADFYDRALEWLTEPERSKSDA